MIKTKHISSVAMASIAIVMFFSCSKKYDMPPVKNITEGQKVSIANLKAACAASGGIKRFHGDTSLYAVVTADETSGNIYKEVYLRDGNGDAIAMKLTSSGGLYVGDSIRVNLNYSYGSVIDVSNGSTQIDSVNTLAQVVKLSVGKTVIPISVTLSQVTPAIDGQLIYLSGIEFTDADVGQPQADAVNHISTLGKHYVEDCGGVTVQVYNSAYANFATQKVPAGKGSMIAVAQNYNGSMELIIRNYNEVQMTGSRCGSGGLDTLNISFTGLANNAIPALPSGWINYNFVSGAYQWEGSTSSPASTANPFLGNSAPYSTSCSCNTSGADAWLITPAIINSSTKYLSFKNYSKYNTAGNIQLFLYVSTDFNGTQSGISSAHWTSINTNQITTNSTIYQTQKIELNNPDGYNNNTNILNNYNGKFYVAFRFMANTTDSTAGYYINNIIVNN